MLLLLDTQLATLVLALDIKSVGVVAVQHGARDLPDQVPGPPASPDPPACVILSTLLALPSALLITGALPLGKVDLLLILVSEHYFTSLQTLWTKYLFMLPGVLCDCYVTSISKFRYHLRVGKTVVARIVQRFSFLSTAVDVDLETKYNDKKTKNIYLKR